MCGSRARRLPLFTLAGGFLTGKYSRGVTGRTILEGHSHQTISTKYVSEAVWAVHDAICNISEELDAIPAQVAIRWLIEKNQFSTVVPIIGVRTVEQLTNNLRICKNSPTADQLARIEQARVGTERE